MWASFWEMISAEENRETHCRPHQFKAYLWPSLTAALASLFVVIHSIMTNDIVRTQTRSLAMFPGHSKILSCCTVAAEIKSGSGLGTCYIRPAINL